MAIERVVVEADGGARGNPGPAGYGAAVLDPDSGDVLAERSGALGVTTNNIAEYQGLIAGLEAAGELGARTVDVRMDSKLVVEQMSGRWKIKHPGLRPLAARAGELVRGFDSVRLQWVPRARNARADALANAAMDAAAGRTSERRERGPQSNGTSGAARRAAPDDERAVAEPAASAAPPAPQQVQAREPASTAPHHWVPPAQQRTRFLLVRHGETALSAERRFSGHGDPPLTDRGQAQALAVAARISTLLGDTKACVVSSPSARARRTAEEVAAVLGTGDVVVEPRLMECAFGAWEGHTFAEVAERWPAEFDAWLGSTAVAPPDGESIDEVAARVSAAVAEFRDTYAGQTVVVVGHVTGIKVVLRDALVGGPGFLHRLHLDPGGLSIVDTWPDGGVSVRLVNDISHLGDLATRVD